jgi:hypothetical protein
VLAATDNNTDFSQTYASEPDTERFEDPWVDCLCLRHKDLVTGEKDWRYCRRLPNNIDFSPPVYVSLPRCKYRQCKTLSLISELWHWNPLPVKEKMVSGNE